MGITKFILAVVGTILFVWSLLIKDRVGEAIKRFLQRQTPQPVVAKSTRSQTRTVPRSDTSAQVLSLVSFAFTAASWGWAAVAPESSVSFGSALFFLAVVSLLIAILRMWRLPRWSSILIVVTVLVGYGLFDWYIIMRPQRGKEFKALLIEGYNIDGECSEIPGKAEMPEWMRDQSKEWQAKAQQLIAEKLDYKDLQLWNNTAVLGRVADINLNAYQCLWTGVKVGALETIVAAHYDAALKHRDYNGPTYWLNAVNGRVDISEALKNGGQTSIYINGGGTTSPIAVHGRVGEDKK